MEPAREIAIVNLMERLAGMTGLRPKGFTYPNPPVVTDEYADPIQINRFPHFIVLQDDGTPIQIVATGGGNHYEHLLRLEIGCYVMHNDGGVAARTWKQRTWDDVFQTVMQDHRLGGAASWIDWGDLRHDVGEFHPRGIWWQPLTIIIDESVEVT